LTFLAASGSSQTSLLAQPGTVAFLVVFGMGVLLLFVFRSMAKHLRKVSQAARDEAEAQARSERADRP
jgi:cobalamin biosynthesis protein CobD/CbiB